MITVIYWLVYLMTRHAIQHQRVRVYIVCISLCEQEQGPVAEYLVLEPYL